jgi:type IV pilus assembly protein PilQ
MSTRTLASTMLVAFGTIGLRSQPAAAARALPTPNDATIVSVSVVPTTGRADVVIRVDGAITLKHFTLTKPDKIVVDMNGATLGLSPDEAYDGVARGGITRVRYSQFTKNVVRVVLTLDGPHSYVVTQENGEVHVMVDGAGEKFEPWESEAGAAVAPADARPAHTTEPAAKERSTPADFAILPTPEREVAKHAQQQSQEPRITVNWENASISEVLGLFATFTGRTILPSKSVSGNVTANIVNLPWDVALKEVMNANGYDVTVNPDGVIVIDTFENIAQRQSMIPLRTRSVRLNYARAGAVAQMVQVRLTRTCPVTTATSSQQTPQLTPNQSNQPTSPQAQGPTTTTTTVQSFSCPQRGAVTADTITNSISITDVPAALRELEDYAKSIDIRQPQVNIKAKIILVDRTTLEGLGLRYDLGSRRQFFNDVIPRVDSTGALASTAGQILLGGNTISAIANSAARVPSAALQLVYSTALGNFDFTTFLEALQQNTLIDVQAEPSASVLNNRTANLTAGTQVPIRIIDAGSSTGNVATAPRATVSFQQTGVILTVTPQITNNRQVQMKVHVENSDVQFQANDVGAVFPKQSVDNEMLVADGETMVVGGLTQTTVNYTRTGLPILVDLPIIGRLFGVTSRSETKRDLLILITPHIIDDGQQFDSGRP